ncbi:YfdX family protein [Thalassospira marina]|uniref:Uncharacterized protein n=1 Tax=Thalassospira marina TaxID=2048283 RepID=A0A2N3KYY9_9PROT|nr:YfdX family protein [Thalassospira marina]AUG51857.1 hypothetical protein CSC3H3_03345 [Thalassospira marina]PKR55785.1 hypothetical protein COO20_00750 [Thalassospira marina]
MKNLSRNIAIVTLAFGVSALAMAPNIASAAENGTYPAIVPNNTSGPHGARKEYDIWLAQHPESPTNQATVSEYNDSFVPNNASGPHRARKEHDIWLAQQAKFTQPDPNSAAMKADFSKKGETVLQQVHQARVALSAGDHDTAKQLLHNARATLSDMYDDGANGNIIITGPLVFDQDFAAGNQAKGNAQLSQVVLPFGKTRGNLDLAYTQLINSHPLQANQTLGLVEQDLSVTTAQVTTGSMTSSSNS